MVLLCVGISSSVNAADIILGKIKYIVTAPNGDNYYRCKNRATVCAKTEATATGTQNLELYFDTGVVVEEVQSVTVLPMYIDNDNNEIVELIVTPLPVVVPPLP